MKLIKFHADFRRMSSLEGLFAVDERGEALLEVLTTSGRLVYFGEVLGKHSDISCEVTPETLETLPVSAGAVAELVAALGGFIPELGCRTISGCNPLGYLHDHLRWEEPDCDGHTNAWAEFLSECGLASLERTGEESNA